MGGWQTKFNVSPGPGVLSRSKSRSGPDWTGPRLDLEWTWNGPGMDLEWTWNGPGMDLTWTGPDLDRDLSLTICIFF